MDSNTAQAVLLERVYVPVFIEKCAQAGINFKDEAELVAALETVASVKAAELEHQAAGVDTNPTPIKQANVLVQGFLGANRQPPIEEQRKQAALGDTAVQEAALSLLGIG